MNAGDCVVMNHPEGYATVMGAGNRFVGWIPNGIRGVVYLLTPDSDRAVVHFAGKLFATVGKEFLLLETEAAVPVTMAGG